MSIPKNESKRLRCERCGSFLVKVTAKSQTPACIEIEANCRNRNCREINEIEVIIGKEKRRIRMRRLRRLRKGRRKRS
jgi:hypothetical protein